MKNIFEIKKQNQKAVFSGFSLPSAAAASGCLLMMISPTFSLQCARDGIELWLYTVLPSLLPFFICTELMIKTGFHEVMGRALERPVRFLMGTPGESAFAFITSILSGYPTGARVTGELCRKHIISHEEAAAMLTFCSTSGPLFIIGAVGAGMLDSAAYGYIILVSHYGAAVMTGLLMNKNSVFNRKSGRTDSRNSSGRYFSKRTRKGEHSTENTECFTDMVTDAVISAFGSITVIGGYIVIFTMITGYIIKLGNLSENEFIYMLTACGSGFLEMTVGCRNISTIAEHPQWFSVAVCSFLVSFGGISVAGQTMSVLKGTGISMSYFINIKIVHGIISLILTIIFMYMGGII